MSRKSGHCSRVEQIFSAVQECAKDDRAEQLKALCGNDTEIRLEVESLLDAADKAKGFLSKGPLTNLSGIESTVDANDLLDQAFDSWKIIRELDSGGMGIVFLAERVDGHYQQQVAIKLARSGLMTSETINRFHAERQILANLRHPNIAQLLDGGTGPGGYPYLVMEYVKGQPIDDWCDSLNLSVDQILSLVCTVCDAVDYANQNLVVHCDLKPSNILVSEGVPKLLDFGIATLMSSAMTSNESSTAQLDNCHTPLTPAFAAPEQIRGQSVTTSTDVYSLGVVMYRLLTGTYPYSITAHNRSEIAAAMDCLEIPPPSTKAPPEIRSKLRGDLDKIVLKALQKDPQERYISAKELLADITRYLAGYPVSVSPANWWYRSRKLISRHKLGVRLTALAIAALWIGGIFGAWHWREAQETQALADQRFAEVRNMINTLVNELPHTIASQPGSTPLRVQLMDEGIEKLDSLVNSKTDNPDLIRELAIAYARVARLQGYPASVNLGDPEKAVKTYEKSIALQHSILGYFQNDVNFAVELARNYSALSLIHYAVFRNSDLAHEYIGKCQEKLTPFISSGDPGVLGWLVNSYTLEAKWDSHDGNNERAIESNREAHELFKSQSSNSPYLKSYFGQRGHMRIHEEWAEIESSIGNLEKALSHEKKRLDIVIEHLQDDQGTVQLYGPERISGDAYHAYAKRLAAVGRFEEAEKAYQTSIKLWETVQQRFPYDASPRYFLVSIYSDFAEFNRLIASSLQTDSAVNVRIEQACEAYASSLKLINKVRIDPRNIPQRNTWSLRPAEISNRFEELCAAN